MGEVYRARDPRLARDVAVKGLPTDVASNPERLHRFELEARATSALNHPNILVIHDIGMDAGVLYSVWVSSEPISLPFHALQRRQA